MILLESNLSRWIMISTSRQQVRSTRTTYFWLFITALPCAIGLHPRSRTWPCASCHFRIVALLMLANGVQMAKYSIAFATMKRFIELGQNQSVESLVRRSVQLTVLHSERFHWKAVSCSVMDFSPITYRVYHQSTSMVPFWILDRGRFKCERV